MEKVNETYSIIVPVYNAERYIERCIESVLSQTRANWELLLIDDGSTDRSWEILDKYAKREEKIRIFRQENAGPGIARNRGIQEAKGDWLAFLDSDDYLSEDYLDVVARYSDCDIVYIDFQQVDEKENPIKRESMSTYSNLSKEQFTRAMMTGKIPWGGHRKVARRSLIVDNKIYFGDARNGEEALYSFRLMQASKNICFASERPVYMYTIREGSLSHAASINPFQFAYEEYKRYLSENDLYDKYGDTLNAFNAFSCVVAMDRIVRLKNGREMELLLKEALHRYQSQRDRNYEIDKKSLDSRARVLLPFINKGVEFPVVAASKIKALMKRK